MTPPRSTSDGDLTPLDEILLSMGIVRAGFLSRIGAFAFCGIFFIGGILVLYAATLSPLSQRFQSMDWVETDAIVTQSKLDWDDESARVDIHYKYRFHGRNYTGKRYGWSESRQNFGITEKKQILKRHPVGSPVLIFIDPDNPSESVIDRTYTGISGMNLFFPIPFLLIGICGLSYAFLGGAIASRTRSLMDSIADKAESKHLVSLADQLRNPPRKKDVTRNLIFTMAQSRIEGFTLLLASIFWNGIVSVFLCLFVGFAISGEGMALFLGLFLIPFVLIGILLILGTLGKFRAPRPPSYVFAFSGLALTNEELDIPCSWMRLDPSKESPDTGKVTLHVSRDADTFPSPTRRKEAPLPESPDEALSVESHHGEALLKLPVAPPPQKKSFWNNSVVSGISATLSWELQPRRERKAVSWVIRQLESDG